MTIREMMIERLLLGGWGRTKPTPEEVQCMRNRYEGMSDEDLYEEFKDDVYKDGQDSMRGW